MIRLLLLYLFCKASSAEIHALKVFTTITSGLLNFPEYQYSLTVDDNPFIYCDGSNKIVDLKYAWLKKLLHDGPELNHELQYGCFEFWPNIAKTIMSGLKKNLNQPEEGVHVLQLISSCDWDEETQKVSFVNQVGYDGEDFLALDFETLTWIPLQPRATSTKQVWDADEDGVMILNKAITQAFPVQLKIFFDKGKSILLRTEHPSLSLLQKSPSSPVSCHATGFYPSRALMFWRKDGEEIHENVDHGEILPNHDGTFQVRVYLNISSIIPEDWKRYDCVFQLIGKQKNIIKLDGATLRINRESPSNISLPIIAVVIALVLVSIAAAAAVGHVVYKKKIVRDPLPSTSHENGTELTETLNPEI